MSEYTTHSEENETPLFDPDMIENLSRFMTLILRHNPQKFNVVLDKQGQCSLDDLLRGIRSKSRWSFVTTEMVLYAVEVCPKQRFEVDGDLIRARYGHSIHVEQQERKDPPDVLYHGTNEKALPLILQKGLSEMSRQYVHLSETTHFATLAGQRRGKLVLLKIDAKLAQQKGTEFYFAGDEVWLSTFIAPECILETIRLDEQV